MKPAFKITLLAVAFFAYTAHWWFDTEGSLAAAALK